MLLNKHLNEIDLDFVQELLEKEMVAYGDRMKGAMSPDEYNKNWAMCEQNGYIVAVLKLVKQVKDLDKEELRQQLIDRKGKLRRIYQDARRLYEEELGQIINDLSSEAGLEP